MEFDGGMRVWLPLQALKVETITDFFVPKDYCTINTNSKLFSPDKVCQIFFFKLCSDFGIFCMLISKQKRYTNTKKMSNFWTTESKVLSFNGEGAKSWGGEVLKINPSRGVTRSLLKLIFQKKKFPPTTGQNCLGGGGREIFSIGSTAQNFWNYFFIWKCFEFYFIDFLQPIFVKWMCNM